MHASRGPDASRKLARARVLAAALAFAIPGGTAALWLAPRPATPAEPPALVIPRVRTEAALAEIARLAATAPDEREGDLARRRELYLAHGLSEARPRSTPGVARTRDEELAALASRLAESGTLDAVRARDVERTVAALATPGEAPSRLGEVGALPRLLAEWGAVRDRRRVAPRLVVHALAWARWNGVHRRPLDEGMSATLLLAYHGWLALHGPSVGTDLREDALDAYVRAGGGRGLEARGFLLLARGDARSAQLAFEAAYEASGNVRLRNHALAIGLELLEPDEYRPPSPAAEPSTPLGEGERG